MVYTDLCPFYFSVFDEHAVDMTLKEFVELLRGERWKAQVEGKQTIIQIAKDIYGETVKVYLFGSRLNDEKRGGDIDLLVRSTGEKKGVLARIRMTARLKLHLGDQKIDVIGDHEDSPVVQEALKNGIQLI